MVMMMDHLTVLLKDQYLVMMLDELMEFLMVLLIVSVKVCHL